MHEALRSWPVVLTVLRHMQALMLTVVLLGSGCCDLCPRRKPLARLKLGIVVAIALRRGLCHSRLSRSGCSSHDRGTSGSNERYERNGVPYMDWPRRDVTDEVARRRL